MKQFVLIVLTIVLTTIVGHAADDVVVEGVTYTWSRTDGAYIVTGWDEETPLRSLHIRAVVNDLDVIAIDDAAFEDNNDIVYLTIDEGITSIGENAFGRCANLQVAILPEGLESIGEEAFAFCTSLTTLAIPSTVTDIYAHAFSGCTSVTDVFFLMTQEEQLNGFDWWDGVYASPGEEEHGGMEFNTNEHTVIHVPEGMLQDYVDSGKFEAWLPLQEDDNCYPLWWIVNFGVVGREYTVCDDLEAVYVDIHGGLYAKDDNHWLTPDVILPGEVDYMSISGMMKDLGNRYDQSNWVVLTNVGDPTDLKGYLLAGNSITGTLINKKNPVIEVSDDAEPVKDGAISYVPNIYIPSSFMGRSQVGELNGKTYAFVQPKPQELIHVEWIIYSEDDGCFYLPEPDEPNHINYMGIKGGFQVSYDLYEGEDLPQLVDCGAYAFNAINRRIEIDDEMGLKKGPKREEKTFTPYIEGGLSDTFMVYPLEMLDDPIATGVSEISIPTEQVNNSWYTIDGRCLGDIKPTAPGFYINGSHKVLVR